MNENYYSSIGNGHKQNSDLDGFETVRAFIHSGWRVVCVEQKHLGKILLQGVGRANAMWVLDKNGQCWISRHVEYFKGTVFNPILTKELIAEIEDRETRVNLRAAIGMKPEPPEWLVTAIKYNFTSPTFDITQYDLDNI